MCTTGVTEPAVSEKHWPGATDARKSMEVDTLFKV